MDFLSERNIKMHKEYLENLRCRFSIFEKSYPNISQKSLKEIMRCKISYSEREAAFSLKADVISHEIFFSSFSQNREICESVKKNHGSEAAFLYTLYEECLQKEGFLFIYHSKIGDPDWYVGREYQPMLLKLRPILAIDLFEHAYFYDYGFDKKTYLQEALSKLDLSKLNVSHDNNIKMK